MKVSFAWAAALLPLAMVGGAWASAADFLSGNPFLRLEPGQSAMRSKAIADNYFQPMGGGGQVVSNTNIFTGQPVYSVPIWTMNAGGEFAYPVALTFSGPTRPSYASTNDLGSSGSVGMGWSLNIPFVAANNKGTVTYSDDVIMASLGPFGGGQILYEPEAGRYVLSTNPGITISAYTVNDTQSPLDGQIEAWIFTLPNGVKLTFGDTIGIGKHAVSNSERVTYRAGGVISGSPYNAAASKAQIYRWNVSRIEDHNKTNALVFDYYNSGQEILPGGRYYDRESHIANITWMDANGSSLEAIGFGLENLEVGEYRGYPPQAAKTDQRQYETKRVAAIGVVLEGNQHARFELVPQVHNTSWGKKRTLKEIKISYGGSMVPKDKWSFDYDSNDFLALKKVTNPGGLVQEFEYGAAPLSNTAGDQDNNSYSFRRKDNGQPLIPEGDNDLFDNWSVESMCDDRACYEIIRIKDAPGTPNGDENRVHVQVLHNSGNYFSNDTAFHAVLGNSETSEWQWQVIPMGDYFLIVDQRLGQVDIYEWNGKKYVKVDDEIHPGLPDPIRDGFLVDVSGTISIVPAGNYFLVYSHIDNPVIQRRDEIDAYLKNPNTGKWERLTRGARGSSTCKLDNPNPNPAEYDPEILHGMFGNAMGCMNWGDNLILAASPKMFLIAHEHYDLIYAYQLNKDGTGFDNVSSQFQRFDQTGDIQHPNHANDWQKNLISFHMGGDYFLIKSYKTLSSGSTQSRYDVMNFDGHMIKRVAEAGFENDDGNNFNGSIPDHPSSWDRNAWVSGDYFLLANQENGRLDYYRKVADASEVTFQKTSLRTDLSNATDMDLQIRLGRNHFAVEYYPENALKPGVNGAAPSRYLSSSNYSTWLYRIKIDGLPEALTDDHYSATVGGCKLRLFDMSFSATDNVMTGYHLNSPSSCDVCDPGENLCEISRASVTLDESATSYQSSSIPQPDITSGFIKQMAWSTSGRLAQAVYVDCANPADPLSRRIKTRRYYFNGTNFSGTSARVVRKVTTRSGLGAAGKDKVVEFDYSGLPVSVIEYNHNLGVPQFEHVKVSQAGIPGSTQYVLFVDHQGQKLVRDSASMVGRVKQAVVLKGSGDTLQASTTIYYPTYTRGFDANGNRNSISDPWPKGVVSNRAHKSITRQFGDGNSRHRTDTVTYHQYQDTLDMPRFSKVRLGTSWNINQTIVDGKNRVLGNVTYDFASLPAQPNGPNLDAANPLEALPLNSQQGQYAISGTSVSYDPVFLFKPNQTLQWRDRDEALTDADLRQGITPVYNLAQGAFAASEITRRNALGLVQEMAIHKGGGIKRYSSTFYEGGGSLPVGIVNNAKWNNCAILTAENAFVVQLPSPIGRLDKDLRWESPGVTYSASQIHTGRYSYKVTDNFGPTTNLVLEDVRAENLDYVVSAWIYAETNNAPTLALQKRYPNGTPLGGEGESFLGSPVGEVFQPRKWQRWEKVITHAELIANSYFDTRADWLRVFIGTGAPSASPEKVIYVDDVVCRPRNSTFSLTAYDMRRQPTQTTNTHHLTISTEYGQKGTASAHRDERGRIINLMGYNKLGENLP